MRRYFKQAAALLTTFSVILMMGTGCAKSASGADSGKQASDTKSTAAEVSAAAEEGVLLAASGDYADMNSERQINKDVIYSKEQRKELARYGLNGISNVWVRGDKLYVESRTDNERFVLVSCNLDFTDAAILDGFEQSLDEAFAYAVSENGAVYVMHTTEYYYVSENRYTITTLSRREGNGELWSVTLKAEQPYGIYCVGERVVIFAGDGLWVYSGDGELEKTFKPWEDAEKAYSHSLAVLDENRVLLICGGSYGDYLREINLETGELVDYERPFWWECEYSCQAGYGYDVFITMESSVVGYNLGDSEYTEIMDCVASDINEGYSASVGLYSLGDGRFISVNDEATGSVYVMEKAAAADISDRIVITLGGNYMVRPVEGIGYEQILAAVKEFNKTNENYYVKIDEKYFDFGSTDIWRENKLDALISAVESGFAPDIILWEDGTVTLSSEIDAYKETLGLGLNGDEVISHADYCEKYLSESQENGTDNLWEPDGRSQSGAEGIVRRIPMGESVSTDLDGDGAAESLTVMVQESSDGTLVPVIQLNGNDYDEEAVKAMTGELVNPDSTYYYLVDLDTEDAWVEIALAAQGEDDYSETAFLRYNSGELFGIGKVSSGAPLTDDEEIKLITAGDGRIFGKSRVDILEKTWIMREWSLTNHADGSAELSEVIAEYYVLYPIRDFTEYSALIQDMTVYTDMDENSGTTVLREGTAVSPYQYYPDGRWVYISYIGGDGAWIKLTEEGILQPMGIGVEEISEYVRGLR